MAENLSKKLYVKNAEDWQKELLRKRFSDKDLEVKVVERGIILPTRGVEGEKNFYEGGVCDNDFNFVAGYFRKETGGGTIKFNCLESSYTVDRKELVQLDEDVIFGGLLAEHFGHFTMECLCRLWYVIKNPELRSKILFVTTLKNGKHRPYTDPFFELMGLEKERIIYVNKPMQCRSVTVPEQAQYGSKKITKEFLYPYRAIKSRVTPGDKFKKIYLTRMGFEFKKHNNVHCFNEKYFEDFFAKRGFEVISPEKLPITEQFSLIAGADEIAATIGTLTHWAMFCKPNTKFIMLNRTSNSVLSLQCLINVSSKVDYYIVVASRNFMYANRALGVCMLGANKYWKKFVADYFGEQIDENDDSLYFEESLDKYIDFWCEKYATSKERLTESFKSMCNRIVDLERELSKDRPSLNYQTHVAYKGWSDWNGENSLSNDTTKPQDIQAIKIKFSQTFYDVYYSVYYNEEEGWSPEVSTGQMAGTTGRAKAITGVKIRLDETGAKKFDILYRVHKFTGEWTDWAKNGEELLSRGVKLNAIQIKLQTKFKT